VQGKETSFAPLMARAEGEMDCTLTERVRRWGLFGAVMGNRQWK